MKFERPSRAWNILYTALTPDDDEERWVPDYRSTGEDLEYYFAQLKAGDKTAKRIWPLLLAYKLKE